jgi:hypothetical protein
MRAAVLPWLTLRVGALAGADVGAFHYVDHRTQVPSISESQMSTVSVCGGRVVGRSISRPIVQG